MKAMPSPVPVGVATEQHIVIADDNTPPKLNSPNGSGNRTTGGQNRAALNESMDLSTALRNAAEFFADFSTVYGRSS